MSDRDRDAPGDALAATAASDEVAAARVAPDAALATLPVDGSPPAPPSSQGAVRRGPDDLSELPEVARELYRIDGELARGGMGRILRARDRRVGRAVAIKESLAPGGSLAARFEREALITARLQHPAIVPVYETGRWPDGEAFYTMKLVAGRPLDEVIAKAETFAQRVALLPHVIAVCEALAYAHDRGIIHRDLKPGNVLIGDYGETVVVDWGLAKDLADGNEAREPVPAHDASGDADASSGALTAYGAAIGTPAYMPPEQASGDAVDTRADVYALGALLYHLLAGAMPYHGARRVDELIELVLRGPPPSLAARAPEVPRELIAIVDRAMARDVDARYPSAKQLAADLRAFQTGQLVSAHRYTAGEILRRWVRRHRGAVVTAAVLLGVLAIVAYVSVKSVMRARDLADARRAAVLEEQGRQELLAGRPARALPHLVEAWRAGRRTPSLALLLGDAMRTADAIEGAVVHGEVPVERVSIGPGGALATADATGLVRLWRADGSAGATLRGHTAEVHAIAWSPDAEQLATASGDTTVRVWDVVTGTERTMISAHGHIVEDVRFSADGTRLLSRGVDGARLWALDASAARPLAAVVGADAAALGTWQGAAALFTFVEPAFALDAPTPTRTTIAIRAAADGAALAEIAVSDGPGVVVFDATGRWAVASTLVDERCVVHLVTLDTGALVETFWPGDAACGPSGLVALDDRAVLFDRTTVSSRDPVTGDAAGTTWPPVQGVERFETGAVSEPVGPILQVAGLRIGDRPTLAVRAGGVVHLVDDATGTVIARLDAHVGELAALDASADGAALVTGGDDGRAVTWRATSWLRSRHDGVLAVAPDGRVARYDGGTPWIGERSAAPTLRAGLLPLALDVAWASGRAATTGPDERLRIWDVATWRELASASVAAQDVSFAPDGAWIATVSSATVQLWRPDATAGPTLAGHDHLVTALAWRPDGGALATASRDGAVRRWDPATGTGEIVAEGDGPVGALAWSPDGGRLAIGLAGGELWVIGAGAPQVLRGHADTVLALAFDPTGTRLISGGRDGYARLWDLRRGVTTLTLEHDGEVRGVALRADGAVVATVARRRAEVAIRAFEGDDLSTDRTREEATVRLWDAATGAPLIERPGGGTPRFVGDDELELIERDPDGLAPPGRSVWHVPVERRGPTALAALAAAVPWRLDAQRLVATATSWRRVPPLSVGRTLDFAEDVVEGVVPRPDVALPATADPALRGALALAGADDLVGAGRASGAIDGDRLATSDELLALAYLRACAGDAAGALRWARRAVATASPDHAGVAGQALVRHAARSGLPVVETVAITRQAAPGDVELLMRLALAYQDLGRYDDALAVMSAIEAPVARLVDVRLSQAVVANLVERLDDAAAFAADAVRLARGDAAVTAGLAESIRQLAYAAHIVFGSSRDRRYGVLATALYPLALEVAPEAARAEILQYQAELATLVADPRPMEGHLDKQLLRRGFRYRIGAIRACYEQALIAEPTLAGTLALTFRIDELGRVEQVEMMPPPGQAGLAAVATCVRDRIQDWRFPHTALSDPTTARWPIVLQPAGM